MRNTFKYEECNDNDYRKRRYNDMSSRESYYNENDDRWTHYKEGQQEEERHHSQWKDKHGYHEYSSDMHIERQVSLDNQSNSPVSDFRNVARPTRTSTYPQDRSHNHPRSKHERASWPSSYQHQHHHHHQQHQHHSSSPHHFKREDSQPSPRAYSSQDSESESYPNHGYDEHRSSTFYDSQMNCEEWNPEDNDSSDLLYPYSAKRSSSWREHSGSSTPADRTRDSQEHDRRRDFYRSHSNPDSWYEKRERRYRILYDLEPAPITSGHNLGHVFESDPPLTTTNSHNNTDSHDSYRSSQPPSSNHYSAHTSSYHRNDYISPSHALDHHPAHVPGTPSRRSTTASPNFITPMDMSRDAGTPDPISSRACHSPKSEPFYSSSHDYHNMDTDSSSHYPQDLNHHHHHHYTPESRISPPRDTAKLSHQPGRMEMDESNDDLQFSTPSRRKKGLSSAWNERYEELKIFKKINGHCMVPQKYPDNPPLGIWVNKQRMEHNLLQDGKKTSMTQDRFQKLEALGFIWAKRKGMTTWNGKYEEMLSYRQKHGDCLVPTKYAKNPALGRWVSTQREQYRLLQEGKATKMTPDKIALLESVGFVWRLQF